MEPTSETTNPSPVSLPGALGMTAAEDIAADTALFRGLFDAAFFGDQERGPLAHEVIAAIARNAESIGITSPEHFVYLGHQAHRIRTSESARKTSELARAAREADMTHAEAREFIDILVTAAFGEVE